jgi:outer membrane protein assembly factor BamB
MDFGFEGLESSDFDVDLQEIEVKKVKKFDRIWNIGMGGSINQRILVHEGVVYFGSMDYNVYAVDADTLEELWRFRTSGIIMESSPVIDDGILYIGSFDGYMYALNLSGKLVWKFKTSGKIISCAVTDDNCVYFCGQDGYVYCLDKRTGSLVWKFRTGDEIAGTVVINGSQLFVGSFDGYFYCLDKETGKEVWRFKTGAEVYCIGPPLVKNGIVYFGSFDNYMYALRAEDGKEVWRVRLGQYGIAAGPVPYKNLLLQHSRDGILYAIDYEGKIKWQFRTNLLAAVPYVDNDMIYITAEDTHIYCIDGSGHLRWKTKTGGPVWWMPAIYGQKLFIGSWDCKLYVLNKSNGKIISTFNTSSSQQAFIPDFKEGFRAEVKHGTRIDDSISEDRYKFRKGAETVSLSDYHVTSEYSAKSEYRQKSDYSSSLVMFEEVMEFENIWISDLKVSSHPTLTSSLKTSK